MVDLTAIVILLLALGGLMTLALCLVVLGLCLKLYTEHFKDVSMNRRKEKKVE
jgi:hypothetical protein